MDASKHEVQYEFKVIVRASEDAWPHEVGDGIKTSLENYLALSYYPKFISVQSVEQVHDGW